MKILSIKALNINSLKGKTEINFEELTKESALFAITGPTGSGKSTLLDIISCALYGRTARLKNPNDLMSRHCGEASCEVEFEIRGKTYRSSWNQKRARNKHDGKFQTAKMELSDVADEKPFPLKSKEVPKKIEELSGLDFARFTQSMMLAQGSFDAFLKADEKERSGLLEKITGTQIYADISAKIFEKHRNFMQELESDQKILDSIELLDNEVVEEKEKELLQNIAQKEKNDVELKDLNTALNWVKRVSELLIENKEHEQALTTATSIKDEHKNDFERLSLANRALNIAPTFSSFTQVKQVIQADKKQSAILKEELEVLGAEIQSKNDVYALVKIAFEKESENLAIQNQKLKEARQFQTQERETEDQITKSETLLKSKKQNLIDINQSLTNLLETYKSVQKQIEEKNAFFLNNANDEKLLSTIGIIEQTIAQHKESESELTVSQNKAKELETTLLSEQKKFDSAQEEVVKLATHLHDKESVYKALEESSANDVNLEENLQISLQDTQTLIRVLESYLQIVKKRDDETNEIQNNNVEEKRLLETHSISIKHSDGVKQHIKTLREKKEREQALKKYEADRINLIEGEACALCGSPDHPYANSVMQVNIDETESMITTLLKELEDKEHELQTLNSRISSVKTKI